MKLSILSLAIGSAFAVGTGSAFALAPGGFNPATIPQVRISGATAQNGGIEAIVRRECQAGTLDSYNVGTLQRVYICNSNGNFGTAGSPIAIHKESSGGSSNGINPVKATTASLQFINLSAIASGCSAGTTVASVAPIAPDTLGQPAYTSRPCATSGMTSAAIPDIGFSDVDPALFGMDGSGLNLFSPNQLIFGVAVTKTLRDALQTAQGLAPVGDAGPAPSLDEGQIAAIFNGTITAPAQISAADATTAVGTNTSDRTTLFVCRRGTSSGTQATTDAYFLQNRITNAANSTPAFLAAQATVGGINYGGTSGTTVSNGNVGSNTAGPVFPVVLGSAKIPVFAGKSNDDVVNCLNRHDAGNRYAVALLTSEYNQAASPVNTTVESNTNTNYPTGFNYIKIGGYLPTIANVIKQKYTYFSEQVVTAKTGLTGIGDTVLDTLVAQLGDGNVVSSINAGFTVYSGEPAGEQSTGLLGPGRSAGCAAHVKFSAMPAGSNTPDTDPVNYTTKNPSGTKVINAIHVPVAVCPSRY